MDSNGFWEAQDWSEVTGLDVWVSKEGLEESSDS